jgi:hypothetical protein
MYSGFVHMFVRTKTTVKSFRDWLIDIMRSVCQLCFVSIGLMMNSNNGDSDDSRR